MKKGLLVLMLVALVVLISSCGSEKSEAVSENKLGLIKEGTLSVCSDVPYAPFEFYDGLNVVGFDADLITDIADQIKLHIEFVDVDFKDIFKALDDKKCDVIASSVSITEDRKKNYSFSDPYYEISQSLLVANSNSKILTDLDKLNGKIIGVGTGSTGAIFAAEHSEANGYSVRSFTGEEELILALKKGEIDAVLQDFPISAYESASNGLTKVTKTFEGKEDFGFVVQKGNVALQKQINAALKVAKDNGDYKEIEKRYFGE